MTKSRKPTAKLDLSLIPGTWYFQHTYQMRDLDRYKLKATSEEAAVREGRKILEEHPDLDEPCVIFYSKDGSLRYTVDLR